MRVAAHAPVTTSTQASLRVAAHPSRPGSRSAAVTSTPPRLPATHAPARAQVHPSSTVLSKTDVAAALPAQRTTSSSGGAPIGLIVGVILVVALGVTGALAARRRRTAA
jgi:hypothetical protein